MGEFLVHIPFQTLIPLLESKLLLIPTASAKHLKKLEMVNLAVLLALDFKNFANVTIVSNALKVNIFLKVSVSVFLIFF